MSNKIIFVIGMHRSGTSCIAGMLTKAFEAKAFPVGRGLPTGHPNPKGYYESKNVVAINNTILEDWGMAWDNLNSNRRAYAKEHILRVETILRKDYLPHHISVVKDPRLCVTLPIWRRAANNLYGEENVFYLFIFRNPEQVMKSWHGLFPKKDWNMPLLWAWYNYYAIETLAEVARTNSESWYMVDFSYGNNVDGGALTTAVIDMGKLMGESIINDDALFDEFESKHKHF